MAAPIEEQLSGVEGLLYFNSTASSDGTLIITVTFEAGTNIDTAVFNVNNRVRLAEPRLPEEVRRNGCVSCRSARTSCCYLHGADFADGIAHDTLDLSNYASINIVEESEARAGRCRSARIFGARDYSMRDVVDSRTRCRSSV